MTSSGSCVCIAPTKLNDREEKIRSAITFSSTLPPPGYTIKDAKEEVELRHLKSSLGWKDPKGLIGYTVNSDYKDIYIYFDYGDHSSPKNTLATKAWKMYNLGGAQIIGGGKPSWGSIRGSVVIVRMEPDYNFSPDSIYKPTFTLDEIYKTLIFFRDSETPAHEIAVQRDSLRMMRNMQLTNPAMYQRNVAAHGNPYYIGSGIRNPTQVGEDMKSKCWFCGKMQGFVGQLSKCSVCKVAMYCSKECQRNDWKKHKKTCRTL